MTFDTAQFLKAIPQRKLLPIATLTQQAQILGLTESIANTLWDQREELSPCLSGGLSGAALFLGHLSLWPGFKRMKDRAHDLLDMAIEKVDQAPTPSFYSGYVGIAWTLEHLNGLIFGTEDSDDANADVDQILLELMETESWTSDYDLISGLVGLGVYALERLPRASGRHLLAKILEHLEALATPGSQGLTWLTPPEHLPPWQRELAPNGYFNLGLAHGVPGVLCLLATMVAAGITPSRSKPLLEGGMIWLKSQLQDPSVGSYLACSCRRDLDRAPDDSTRIAWCYGDLGASLALLNTARLVQNTAWEKLALNMGRLAAKRPIATSGVKDPSLCHGSGGNLQLFHRLYRSTGEPVFLGAARTYLQHVLESHQPGKGFAGFKAYRPDETGLPFWDESDYKADPGLLEGATGVGLALLSLLDGVELSWDRFLLISTPFSPPLL